MESRRTSRPDLDLHFVKGWLPELQVELPPVALHPRLGGEDLMKPGALGMVFVEGERCPGCKLLLLRY